MNTSVTPAKLELPITPPPLEPEKLPTVIRDQKPSDTKRDDEAAGDEGIDDKEDDDSESGAATSDEDHEEDLGEE